MFKPDALIFDVDGVLLDVSRSFPQVIRVAIVKWWEKYFGTADCQGYTSAHEWVVKRHGAFNDDYDIAWTLLSMSAYKGGWTLSSSFPTPDELEEELGDFQGTVEDWVTLSYGNIVPRNELREFCSSLYHGTKTTPGLYQLEKPMISKKWNELPLPVAVYSGRNAPEWELAKSSLGWCDFPDDLIIHMDSGITKPSPKGLEILCDRLGAASPYFFGDTAADAKALSAFGRGKFVAIGELLPESELIFKSADDALAALL